ncbi:BTB/POZ domain-containing protein [Candidatus Protochlamydia phocaeensis]|uniref:BTB/POZ domain-containing protein n=1 Tax=Candidatus Protochlamydia phocaeensis TaxID=1414722 RepID=UPI00083903D4|nr:BTB/POZ domain-containing protein [Candidatus Protochlamydia phocaeensis]
MISSLHSLHLQFSQALQEGLYMGPSRTEPSHLTKMAQKQIHLPEVYERAQEEIRQGLENATTLEELESHIEQLGLLEADGTVYYQRYCEKTNTWLRRFLKGLARYTPTKLKAFLPHIFSNGMEEAERRTKAAYDNYRSYLRGRVQDLTTVFQALRITSDTLFPSITPLNLSSIPISHPSSFDSQPDSSSNPSSDSTTPALNPEIISEPLPPLPSVQISAEFVQECRQKFITQYLKSLKAQVAYLNQVNENKISALQFKSNLIGLISSFSKLFRFAPDLDKQTICEEVGIDPQLRKFFSLEDNALLQALLTGQEPEKIAELLKPSAWSETLEKLAAPSYTKFLGISERYGIITPQLADESNVQAQARSRTFFKYKGAVRIQPVQLKALMDLKKYMEENKECLPSSLELIFDQSEDSAADSFDLPTLEIILQLSDFIPHLSLSRLTSIDLKQLNATPEQEKKFIEIFPRLNCPDLKSLTMTDHSKEAVSPEQFSALLQVVPSSDLMKACLLACNRPQDIVLPLSLLERREVDLTGYPLELALSLIRTFPSLNSLTLDQAALTDQQVLDLLQSGCFKDLNKLNLKGCTELTTDVLFTLTEIPTLNHLILPDLKAGTFALTRLPKFDNPFKVNLFYTQAALTRPYALSLYNSLSNFAVLFQIPLAKAGETQVFSANHTALDPKSVTLWMFKNDYLHLQPQSAVQTIIADNCEYINDDNVVEFVKRFPNATVLSFFNCRHLTDKGVEALLQAHPQVQKIDLTNCSGVTSNLLIENQLLWQERKNLSLVLSGTQVSKEIAQLFIENGLEDRLHFEEKMLKITNEELTDEEALERILASRALNQLSYIDLEGCENLTDAALSKLLDRLNVAQRIQDPIDSSWSSNPQRLNIAGLNLRGCRQITEKAFDGLLNDGKINPKLLETLTQVAIEGTQINPQLLITLYPQMIVQNQYQPITLAIEPNGQLERCQFYFSIQVGEEDPLKRTWRKELSKSIVFDRMAVELFKEDILAKGTLDMVERIAIDPNEDQFREMSLSFETLEALDAPREDQQSAQSATFNVHRDALYSQSEYFRTHLRPGSEEYSAAGMTFINQNATPKAAQTIIDLIYGRDICATLDWKTAAEAAELASSHNLNLASVHYQKLIQRIEDQFNLQNADDILLRAKALKDKKLTHYCEDRLFALLHEASPAMLDEIDGLAQSHGLFSLQEGIAEIRLRALETEEAFDLTLQNQEQISSDEELARQLQMAEEAGLTN